VRSPPVVPASAVARPSPALAKPRPCGDPGHDFMPLTRDRPNISDSGRGRTVTTPPASSLPPGRPRHR
jgi:hypothetical protein